MKEAMTLEMKMRVRVVILLRLPADAPVALRGYSLPRPAENSFYGASGLNLDLG